MKPYNDIRNDIEAYVFDVIVPLYKEFDSAHREDHANTVISQAMELLDRMPEGYADVDREILFVAAACHDIGLANGRDRHHLDSGVMIRSNPKLKEWFSEEQIEIIAQAAEDHRASGKSAPRSIYGMLVAEADRVIDGKTIIRRTIQFGLNNYPDLDRDGHIERAVAHLKEKYGRGGYMKLWIPWSDNAARLADLQDIIADAAAVYTATASSYDSLI
ncbi:MAG: HD domain-containing protein [Bacteroidales bacterium]|nr:HD domain-containing protein [Bacteroidales bacterium]